MQATEIDDGRLRKQMRKVFFDLSPEGILIYDDPAIGVLANAGKRLAVVANVREAQLELKVGGAVERAFCLKEGVAQACTSAFGAYFSAFESACLRPALEACAA